MRNLGGVAILMNDVKYIVGTPDICDIPLMACSPEAIVFASELSTLLMKSSLSRRFSDVAAFAFWCRKGNVEKIKENCPEYAGRLGRGLCFHVAPSNIPINFAFTYLFGLLAGCANIVRIPSKEFPQTELLLDELDRLLDKHGEIKKRTAFVRYPADSSATLELSKMADARMIWGGDKTVLKIKSLETKPKCVDITFADRYSLCVLDGKAVESANDDALNRLSDDFYNDTYLMDQNACSSPQMILWLNDSEYARKRFWDAVFCVAKKKYLLQAAVSVDKYTQLTQDSIDSAENIKFFEKKENLLYRVELMSLNKDVQFKRGHGGYFYEHSLANWDELFDIVSEKYQTITYFGIDAEELRSKIVTNRLRGIDRIVPIGKAMDIGPMWDGYDIIRMLSRKINLI